MKKLALLALIMALSISLSACCRFHRKGPCGPGPHCPCKMEKPCEMDTGTTPQKPSGE